MSQLVFTALPPKHQGRKWNWGENPAWAQPGTEGIIVLIALILCPAPPSRSNSSHHSPPPPLLLLCGSLSQEPPWPRLVLLWLDALSVDQSNLCSSSQLKIEQQPRDSKWDGRMRDTHRGCKVRCDEQDTDPRLQAAEAKQPKLCCTAELGTDIQQLICLSSTFLSLPALQHPPTAGKHCPVF